MVFIEILRTIKRNICYNKKKYMFWPSANSLTQYCKSRAQGSEVRNPIYQPYYTIKTKRVYSADEAMEHFFYSNPPAQCEYIND